MGYKISLKGENMKNNRRAFLCCSDGMESFYEDLWDKRLGEYITRVDSIDDSTGVYIIDRKNKSSDERHKSMES